MKRFLDSLLSRLPTSRIFGTPVPTTAVAITEEHVAVVRVEGGAEPVAWFVAPLPKDAVRTSPVQPNVLAADAVRPLLEAGRARVCPEGGPVTLCLPDAAGRIALVATDALPRRREEVREVVAWRMKKSLPYRLEEAVVDVQPFPSPVGHVLLAGAIRRRILAEYEGLLESAGFEVASVVLSTLALAEQIPGDARGDVLVVNAGIGWFSMLIVNAERPVFHRCKSLPESERRGAERDWFVSGEFFPTMEYYRTRLGGTSLSRVFLHVEGPGWDGLRETLFTAVGLPVERLGPVAGPALPGEVAERIGPALAAASRGQQAPADRPAADGGAAA